MAVSGGYGRKTGIGGTAVALVASSTPVQTGVRVYVVSANTNTVYFGNDASVTTSTGVPVVGGDSTSFDVGWFGGDLANLYVIGSTTGLAVSYWYV